jgi:hypothetical protein
MLVKICHDELVSFWAPTTPGISYAKGAPTTDHARGLTRLGQNDERGQTRLSS